MKEEVADDLGLAAHEEGKRGGHEVPDEDLVVVERLRALGVLRRHRPHGLAAVADDRPPQQPPRLPLRLRLLPQGRGRRHRFIDLRRRGRVLLLGSRGLEWKRVREEDAVEEREVAGNGGAGVGGDGDRYMGGRGGRASLRGLRLRRRGDEEGEAPAVRGMVRVGQSGEERGCGARRRL